MRHENIGTNGYQKQTNTLNENLNHGDCESSEDNIATHIYFLDRDELYDTVKPYVIRYEMKTDIPPDNIKRLLRPVTVRDLRTFPEKLLFADCGFQVLTLASSMSYGDYEDEEKIKTVHVPEILDRVKEKFSADDVHALEHVIRRRHPTWPIATGESYNYEQPASRAHLGQSSPH